MTLRLFTSGHIMRHDEREDSARRDFARDRPLVVIDCKALRGISIIHLVPQYFPHSRTVPEAQISR